MSHASINLWHTSTQSCHAHYCVMVHIQIQNNSRNLPPRVCLLLFRKKNSPYRAVQESFSSWTLARFMPSCRSWFQVIKPFRDSTWHASCHTYEWGISRKCACVVWGIWIRHVACMDEACHTHEWGHVAHTNAPCHRYECVVSQTE